MIKIIRKISTLLIILLFATTISYATDINMNLQSGNSLTNSLTSNSINNGFSNSSSLTTTVSGQSTNQSSNNQDLSMSNVLNILLIVVGVVLILLGIAILIRIHGR